MVASSNLDMVKKLQADFGKGDFNAVVSVFADDAVVTIGTGDSEAAVAYGGRFVGIAQIKYFYAGRLGAGGVHPQAVIRPFCIVENLQQEFGRWVIIGGQIHDSSNKTPVYKGQYMEVWSINPKDSKVGSLRMFFDVDAVLP